MTRPLTIWLLGDGKPGHENQSIGLAEALGRCVPTTVYQINLATKRWLPNRVTAALRDSASLPPPRLIIGAGHATHGPLLWLARKYQAMSIVLMRPSLPLAWFDMCIAPAHDFPNGHQRPNLILTCGALNRVAPPATAAPRSGHMILLGGPSNTHGWDGGAMLAALTSIASATTGDRWQLTDSRRTPAGFVDEIRARLPAIEVFSHTQTTPDWLPGKLAAAADVWVTEDSVSMIYEALSSGARVGLLPVPRLTSSSRVLRGLEDLISRGFLTTLAAWHDTRRLTEAPVTLREADRCAHALMAMI